MICCYYYDGKLTVYSLQTNQFLLLCWVFMYTIYVFCSLYDFYPHRATHTSFLGLNNKNCCWDIFGTATHKTRTQTQRSPSYTPSPSPVYLENSEIFRNTVCKIIMKISVSQGGTKETRVFFLYFSRWCARLMNSTFPLSFPHIKCDENVQFHPPPQMENNKVFAQSKKHTKKKYPENRPTCSRRSLWKN